MAVASERRRALLLALAGLPFAARAGSSDPTAGLKRWGNGEFRRFGFLVYEGDPVGRRRSPAAAAGAAPGLQAEYRGQGDCRGQRQGNAAFRGRRGLY